ncbi:uncharacterized protein [Onthophagus taurus]|uniref:uncharacterized protein isoform X2 n=1 Tax=Onthophagus taurus TaxID=166361 RepID=UPI0039BE5401
MNLLTPFVCLLVVITRSDGDGTIQGLDLLMAPSHTALSGDFHVQIRSSLFPPLLLQLSRLDQNNSVQTLTTFPVLPEARSLSRNLTIVKIPCGYFSKGGQYYILLKKKPIGENKNGNDREEMITRSLDVRWPMPQLLLTPEHIQTYPEEPVTAILEFPEVVCPPIIDTPPSAIPEFWLELHYCGHSILMCDDPAWNKSAQVLYSEQIRGFPGRRILTLRCELFGLAGHYSLTLRPTISTPSIPRTATYVKAEWSKQFVFNVHASSIFPCGLHSQGIKVLFEYPSCILNSGDKVRVFAKQRADVASLLPPTQLKYVAEQRVVRGQHSLHFSCELFSERYVEYCFVYVSQAITGAVADVRIDCVPTLPVRESENGGWGPWTQWTPCSSTCIGGTKSRYRFCDSPQPAYGAKYCEGEAIQTEKCGLSIGNNWECFYSNSLISTNMVADIPEVREEVSEHCRCGCTIILGQDKPRRLLATSSQSCPERTFWLIRAEEDYVIEFKVEHIFLPCETQWLKIRDGSSLSDNLLEDLRGYPNPTPSVVNSTGPNLLLEFFGNEDYSTQSCGGGFVAQAAQKLKPLRNHSLPIAQEMGVLTLSAKLTAIHIAIIFFLGGLLIATLLLGAQYIFKYRKYHIAKAEDQDSLTDSTGSCAALTVKNRAISNSTLLTEVISLTRLRPSVRSRNKHSRLRESVEHDPEEREATLAKEEDSLSDSSQTLTQGETVTTAIVAAPSSSEIVTLPCSSSTETTTDLRKSCLSGDSGKDEDEVSMIGEKEETRISTATLTKGYYSPASQISTATIRTTNIKENKEKKNRQKLLAGPTGSEFSLAVNDLELDYYDYNVVNAGAAPGSYLGMDPAFLVWIPPLDETGEILPGDLKPKEFVDPGSNTETPEDENEIIPKIRSFSISEGNKLNSPVLNKLPKRIYPLVDIKSISNDSICFDRAPITKTDAKVVAIQLHEFTKIKLGSPVKVHKEKETKVEKSPSLDEIKFADDDDDAEKSYQDSNLFS